MLSIVGGGGAKLAKGTDGRHRWYVHGYVQWSVRYNDCNMLKGRVLSRDEAACECFYWPWGTPFHSILIHTKTHLMLMH